MSEDMPHYGGDDQIQAILDNIARTAVEKYKADDELAVTITPVLDDHGYQVEIGDDEVTLGRAVADTILEALIIAEHRLMAAIAEFDETSSEVEHGDE